MQEGVDAGGGDRRRGLGYSGASHEVRTRRKRTPLTHGVVRFYREGRRMDQPVPCVKAETSGITGPHRWRVRYRISGTVTDPQRHRARPRAPLSKVQRERRPAVLGAAVRVAACVDRASAPVLLSPMRATLLVLA